MNEHTGGNGMKAVLVLKDIPKFCVECPLIHLGERFICCNVANRWCGDEEGFFTSKTKPTWCPLKPLPTFKDIDLNDSKDVFMFFHGWNTCLAVITGETE